MLTGICIGTREANYKINWSGLRKPLPGCAFEKVTIVGGMFVTGGVSCVLGKKDKPVHIRGRNDYIMRLRWTSKKYVVLYDVPDRRSWMVDGVSTLLHLAKASLHHDKNDDFKDLSLFDEDSLQEPTGPQEGGKRTSISVLTSEYNINLALHKKPWTSTQEISVDEAGSQSSKISRAQSYYTFGERVESICDTLEQMIAHQADVSTQDGVGFRLKKTMRRQLEGFDFMDIATDEGPIWPRMTTLRATGQGWVDFTRSMHAVTLFGSGFGDLFRPVATQAPCNTCQLNIEVPKGQDYLAVCVPELTDILQRQGPRTPGPWRLVDEIYWHAPDKTFEPCSCRRAESSRAKHDNTATQSHERIQVLLPSSFPKFLARNLKSPAGIDNFPRGALLFGHSRRFPLRWKGLGAPVEGDPAQDELVELEASFQDSGIGTSLASSSGEGGGSRGSPGSPPCSSGGYGGGSLEAGAPSSGSGSGSGGGGGGGPSGKGKKRDSGEEGAQGKEGKRWKGWVRGKG